MFVSAQSPGPEVQGAWTTCPGTCFKVLILCISAQCPGPGVQGGQHGLERGLSRQHHRAVQHTQGTFCAHSQ